MQLQWAAEAGAARGAADRGSAFAQRPLQSASPSRPALLGLVPLVETHSEEDIAKLAYSDWEIVGVNNRDLATFEVDLDRSVRLAASLPEKTLKRGGERHRPARRHRAALAAAGFDAYLIGESLLAGGRSGSAAAQLAGAGLTAMRPKVKICGVTTVADARRTVELGADYLGLNFYEKSPRFVSRERALEIRRRPCRGQTERVVGVFVGRSARVDAAAGERALAALGPVARRRRPPAVAEAAAGRPCLSKP